MKKRIRKIIKKEGLNVNKFSKIIGVNRSTLSHILSGRNNPSVEVLEKILDNLVLLNEDGSFELNMEYFSFPHNKLMINHKFLSAIFDN